MRPIRDADSYSTNFKLSYTTRSTTYFTLNSYNHWLQLVSAEASQNTSKGEMRKERHFIHLVQSSHLSYFPPQTVAVRQYFPFLQSAKSFERLLRTRSFPKPGLFETYCKYVGIINCKRTNIIATSRPPLK